MGRHKVDKRGADQVADEFAKMAREFFLSNFGRVDFGVLDKCPVCGKKRTRTVSEQEKVSLKERAMKAWQTHARNAAERRKMKEEGGKSLE